MLPATPPDFHGSKGQGRIFSVLRGLGDAIVPRSFLWLHPGNVRSLSRHLPSMGIYRQLIVELNKFCKLRLIASALTTRGGPERR